MGKGLTGGLLRNCLRNTCRSALAVNCWVIIHCLEISCKGDQITNAKREWFTMYLLTTDRQTVNYMYYSTIHTLELIYFDSNTQTWGPVVLETLTWHLVLINMYILMLLYMYIAPGQGQINSWGQMLMSTKSPYHFAHLLQVLKRSLWNNYDFKHI